MLTVNVAISNINEILQPSILNTQDDNACEQFTFGNALSHQILPACSSVFFKPPTYYIKNVFFKPCPKDLEVDLLVSC